MVDYKDLVLVPIEQEMKLTTNCVFFRKNEINL